MKDWNWDKRNYACRIVKREKDAFCQSKEAVRAADASWQEVLLVSKRRRSAVYPVYVGAGGRGGPWWITDSFALLSSWPTCF